MALVNCGGGGAVVVDSGGGGRWRWWSVVTVDGGYKQTVVRSIVVEKIQGSCKETVLSGWLP